MNTTSDITGSPQGRIHQEDFNQALGAGGDQKYQKYAGCVSLARMAKVLSAFGNHDSLDQLLRSTVLSVAVGNLDMHAKNLSLCTTKMVRRPLPPHMTSSHKLTQRWRGGIGCRQ